MTEYDSDDDLPPELEDMSETIAAARKLRLPPLSSGCRPCSRPHRHVPQRA